jgi:uncharacterized protein
MRAQDVLPDHVNQVEVGGVTVRKGSVGAFLANARVLQDPGATAAARAAATGDIKALAPALRALGLFDVLEIRDPQLRALVEPTVPQPVAANVPDLDALYAPPSEMIQKAVLDHLIGCHEPYLKAATFFCLATGSGQGLDASPRGGPPGFVHVLDAHTVAFADWPGNNRIESLRNLERDDRVGMLFIFPGLEVFLRINGHGRVSTAPELLAELAEQGRTPKTATVVAITEVLMHCGKAVNRARLWAPASQVDRASVPTVGQMLAELTRLGGATTQIGDEQVGQINAHYEHEVRHALY